MDEEFTTMIYPSVQENIKLPTKGEVRLEEPVSSAGTLSSLQNLDKDLSFTNQFLDTSSVPLMTTPVIDLTVSQLASITIQASIPTSTAMQGHMMHQLETKDLSGMIKKQTVEFINSHEIDRKIEDTVKELVTASVQHAMRAHLRARFKDLPTSDMKEIL
ncbi:hypothetical protein Tco_0191687 [Tanacetum coccineum]